MAQPTRRNLTVILLVCATALSACNLPRNAPAERDILSGSVDERDFSVYPVTRANLAQLASWPQTGPATDGRWPGRAPGGPGRTIAAGDLLNIVVWDNESNSLLTGGLTRSVNLAGVEVAPDGSVFMPYLENVHVAGQTPEAARRALQTQMATLMPSAQVQLAMASGRQNSVDLVGGVTRPGSYPVPDGNFSVLGLIAQGGGVPAGMRNPQVRLIRGASRYQLPLARLYDNPALDATLRGGDKVFVEEDERYFVALGATGIENIIPFPKEEVSALDALSLASGLDANRASLRGILILREYPASATRPGGAGGPEKERTVFTIDLSTADGLFSARQFAVNSGDLVLVTESPITGLRTLLQLIGIGTGTIRQLDTTFE